MNNINKKMVEALENFRKAANEVCIAWDDLSDDDSVAISEKYPFNDDYCGIAMGITHWVESSLNILEARDYMLPDHDARMHRARILAEYNNKLFCKLGESEMLLTFDTDEFGIYDPFHDETGRDIVDPVIYYGKAFLTSGFYMYDEELTKRSDTVNHSPRVQDYIDELIAFKNSLLPTADEMLESLEHEEYDSKYDIVITHNGHAIRIPLNADSHMRLQDFIECEIEESQQ